MPERQNCPYMKKCGACTSIGQDYQKTLEKKERRVRELLAPYIKVDGIVGMEDPYYYRNKIHRVVSYEIQGKRARQLCGIYKEGSHKIVEVDHCLIEDEKADAIIKDVLALVKSFKIQAYNEDSGRGLLRHILIRTAHATGEIMLVLVLAEPVLPGKNHFVKEIRKLHPEITTIVINVNNKRTNMILGERESAAYGKGYIKDLLCGKNFRISARSFYQVNSVQTEKLYRQAIEWAALKKGETAIDAYCGIGTIGIIAADNADEVIGIESNRDAVRDASINAKENNVKNIRFVTADAGEYLAELAAQGKRPDVIFMDPPRSGASEEFLAAAVKSSPGRIVYVSCGPETLARDLKWLKGHGYRAKNARCYDLFPFTGHVETVCLLSKLHEAKHHINVKVDMDELDLTSSEAKATYKEIGEWVQEHYGFHVTNLNIAQVKQKHGIIERENYNKPKSEGANRPVDDCSAPTGVTTETSRQPGCPEEKVKAMEDALRHFQMI